MKTKLFAIMAVLALGIVAFGGIAADIDGDDAKNVTITYDGNVKLADVQALFPGATADKVQYITTLDAKAVEEMSIVSYNAWEAIENFVDGGLIVFTAQQYADAPDQKKVDSGVKAFGMDDTKTVATIPASINASYELYEEGVVALMIEEAKEGTFTQADIDKAVEDAKKGMFTKAQVDEAVAEALKNVKSDDATIYQIGLIIALALLMIVGFFGIKAITVVKKSGGKLF